MIVKIESLHISFEKNTMETADKKSVSAAWNVNVFHAADTDEIFESGRTDQV